MVWKIKQEDLAPWRRLVSMNRLLFMEKVAVYE